MAWSSFIPSRSVLAGGVTGLSAWGIVLLANHYGVTLGGEPVTQESAYMIATVIGGIVTHFVPDSAKDIARQLNVKLEHVAAILPTAEAKYPTGKNGDESDVVRSIQGWKQ